MLQKVIMAVVFAFDVVVVVVVAAAAAAAAADTATARFVSRLTFMNQPETICPIS